MSSAPRSNPPANCWVRKLNATPPSSNVHYFSRPPMMEALSLLPVAYRVGTYIREERAKGKEPIFDLNGIQLEPPNPGPHAGVPLGGMGGGCIGRGFRGEFRRWSIYPGKYVHHNVEADVFCVRVKRKNGTVHSKVLSVCEPSHDSGSCLTHTWDWTMPPDCATYHALFPMSWTVYENPVPGIRVTVKQVSPFIPNNYSDSSLPTGAFTVQVENTTAEDMEISVMFTFQNGFDSVDDIYGGRVHSRFSVSNKDGNNDDATIGASSTANCSGGDSSSSSSSRRLKVEGVLMNHDVHHDEASTDADAAGSEAPTRVGSYAIAASVSCDEEEKIDASSAAVVSCCTHFITGIFGRDSCSGGDGGCCASGDPHRNSILSEEEIADIIGDNSDLCAATGLPLVVDPNVVDSAARLWSEFTNNGDISDNQHKVSRSGTKVGAAVCVRQTVPAGGYKDYNFSLAWDHPIIKFGDGKELPRYYTRFFGKSGRSAAELAAYALLHLAEWDKLITDWQQRELAVLAESIKTQKGQGMQDKNDSLKKKKKTTATATSTGSDDCHTETVPAATSAAAAAVSSEAYGGVTSASMDDVLLENVSLDDQALPPSVVKQQHQHQHQQKGYIDVASSDGGDVDNETPLLIDSSPSSSSSSAVSTSYYEHMLFNEAYFLCDGGTLWTDSCNGVANPNNRGNGGSSSSSSAGTDPSEPRHISLSHISQLCATMTAHNSLALVSNGDQSILGQFLYYEGHEYLMYNTYDVHFYASFSLLHMFPQLELSIQRDFTTAVHVEDPTERRMLGEGHMRRRKTKGAVPHDLGSPTEEPWTKTNVYNFQDVSRWKDLGPKYILQIYRNIVYLQGSQNHAVKTMTASQKEILNVSMLRFLEHVYPTVLSVMKYTQQFDRDEDGMIENEGFPDQTYDIWTASGVHAYCGGLWIAACEATVCMAQTMGDTTSARHFKSTASRAREVYVRALWNGTYLNYDSSTSGHHDSIMADMTAGQWYSRACDLPPPLTPQQAFSCYKVIYDNNVVIFGDGKFKGAVNGMKPARGTQPSSVDNSCLQSREVWTGTTYALAAGMLQEAMFTEEHALAESQRRKALNRQAAGILRAEGSLSGGAVAQGARSSGLMVEESSLTTAADDGDDFGEGEDLDGLDRVEMYDTTKAAVSSSSVDTAGQANLQLEQPKSLTRENKEQLFVMAYNTARGIHDAGWQEYGYWFNTPEAWERSGNYRALGYMRPLSIWAIQFANAKYEKKFS